MGSCLGSAAAPEDGGECRSGQRPSRVSASTGLYHPFRLQKAPTGMPSAVTDPPQTSSPARDALERCPVLAGIFHILNTPWVGNGDVQRLWEKGGDDGHRSPSPREPGTESQSWS